MRYLVDRGIQGRHDSVFPWGTFVVNVVASFVLGVVTAGVADHAVAAVLGIGFCGALSTYSTFSYETFGLIEKRALLAAAANLLGSVAAGLLAAGAGFLVGSAVLGAGT